MSITEGNARDRDGRNSDGWGEEEEKKRRGERIYTNRRKSRRKMEWRGIELTLGEGRKKRKIEWVNSR